MYCKICGAALNPGDVFCKNCGASNANTNPQPVAPAVEPTPVQNVNPVGVAPVQQPVQPEVQPVQPEMVQSAPQPVYAQPMQPTFTQPVQQPVYQQPVTNNEKSSGKGLMIIGIVVGILAVAVIGYLIYSSLANKDNGGNNDGGGTTVVTQNTYSVQFEGYLFNVSSDYVAVVSGSKLNITTGKWQAVVQGSPATAKYMYITETAIRNALSGTSGVTIESLTEKTYSGLKYWQVDLYAASDGSRATALYAQRLDGGYWYIFMNHIDYSKVSTASANEILEVVKNAKQSTTSNIETNKEVANLPEFNFSEESTEPGTETQEVTE